MIQYPKTSSDRETQLLHCIEFLRAERDTALDRVAELEDKLGIFSDKDSINIEFSKLGLSPICSRMMTHMWYHNSVSRHQLFIAAYGDEPDKFEKGNEHIVAVHLCYARRKMKKYGISFDRIGNEGWCFNNENRNKFKTLISNKKEGISP